MRGIPARKLYEDRRDELELEFVVEVDDARLPITTSDVNRPGLALAGFTENFLYERIQILGETEMLYLDTLSPKEKDAAIDRLFERDLPGVIVSKGLPIPERLAER
jgi:HPr kinase/phosphorylase